MRGFWISFGSKVALFLSLSQAAPNQPEIRHRVVDGFLMEKVAGEPAVLFPMFAAFDDRGRLFVAESSGLDLYAELSAQTRKCRVSLLEDRDGDGRFETAHVFADRLVFPMGLVWRDGRLYVADPPDLVCFEDRNGDGIADERRVILSGFGHRDNGSLHGLTFGPDGLLYMTMGEPDGYRLTRRDGTVLTGESGVLIRCRPDGTDPEVLGRGFVNLVEIVFTSNGSVIGTDNWFQKPEGGVRDALVHLVEGGLYPMHPDIGTPYPVTGDPLPAVSLYPAVALSGLTLYRGQAFPAEMRGNLFSAQHNARKIARHTLIPERATFRAEDHDFVTSDDPDFHPSDVLEAADGSLFVVDTGGWYVQHCPTGKIRNSRASGGIYQIRFKASEPMEDPWGLKIQWRTLTSERLAQLLEDGRHAVRDHAQLLLSTRGAESVNALAVLLEGGASVTAKQHALWALSANPDPSALRPLRRVLTIAEPELSSVSAHALGLRADRESAPILSSLLGTAALPVRLAAAQALARCPDRNSLPSLWAALREPSLDRFLEHALIHAAHWIADEPSLRQALQDIHPRVQKAALLLLDQTPRSALQPDTVIARVAANDPDLRKTALQILQKHPDWARHTAQFIESLLHKSDPTDEETEGLRDLILAYRSDATIQHVVADALAQAAPAISHDRLGFLLATLAQTSFRSPPAAWIDALERCLQHSSLDVQLQAVKTAALWQIPKFDSRLVEWADHEQAPPELRMEALRAVLPRRAKLSRGPFALLLRQVGNDSSPISQLAGGELLGRAELSDEQIKPLLMALRDNVLVSPSVLLAALLRASDEVGGFVLDYLFDSVQRGWRPTNEEITAIQNRFSHSPKADPGPLIATINRWKNDASQRLAALEPLLVGGDAERGRRIVFGNKVACSTCHRAGREGGLTGPDLTKIGAIRSGRDLIESIVLPSATFAQGYESYTVVLKDGRETDGIIVRQTSDVMMLRDSSGAEHHVRQGDVRELKRRTISLMPEGLDRALTADELRDLLAFLQSLK